MVNKVITGGEVLDLNKKEVTYSVNLPNGKSHPMKISVDENLYNMINKSLKAGQTFLTCEAMLDVGDNNELKLFVNNVSVTALIKGASA